MIRATATFRPRSDLGRFIEVNITPAVRMAVQESCELIRDRAKELCPVDTGALRDSIEVNPAEETRRTIRGSVGPHMYYAEYVEYGTGIRGANSAGAGSGPYSSTWPGMPAQPFMRPSLDEMRGKVLDIFSNDVGLAVGK